MHSHWWTYKTGLKQTAQQDNRGPNNENPKRKADLTQRLSPVVPKPDDAFALQAVEQLERVLDGLVHVEVLVGGQSTHKDHFLFSLSEFLVLLIESVVLFVGHRIVRVAPIGRVLLDNHAPGTALGGFGLVGRVFVLGYAGVVDLQAGVVHHIRGLIVTSFRLQEFSLKTSKN